MDIGEAKKLTFKNKADCIGQQVNGVTLKEISESEKTITVEYGDVFFNISYYTDSDSIYLAHNNGYCSGTSDLTVSYPNNEDYESDDILVVFLEWVKNLERGQNENIHNFIKKAEILCC